MLRRLRGFPVALKNYGGNNETHFTCRTDYLFCRRECDGAVLREPGVSKEGKRLTGAAKTSFIKKCKVDACATKAVSKDGKPLSGAAKNSFMKKCAKEA